MINLETLFKNHFDSKEISFDELKKFAQDHLQRITATNPGNILDAILADTGAKYTAYFGTIVNEDVANAVRQAQTLGVNYKLEEFRDLVSRKEGDVRSAFGKDSPTYQEFYPHGLTEYSKASKENVETLMQRMVSASTSYSAQLPAGFVTAFTNIQSQYTSLRNAQLGKKGQVTDLQDTRDDARTALELQLMANIHFIGYKYPGDPQQCLAYFDQSFLRNEQAADEGTPDTPPGA